MASGNNDNPHPLLLLPPLPSPFTKAALSATYRPAIAAALQSLADEVRKSKKGAILDIALPLPYLVEAKDKPRSAVYQRTQRLVAGVYKLVCVIAAKKKINVEDDDGIDVRVLLLAYAGGADAQKAAAAEHVLGNYYGPVIDLQTLACCGRNWSYIVGVESDEGKEILRRFSISNDIHLRIRRIPKAEEKETQEAPAEDDDSGDPTSGQHHVSVIVGGTFDHLHIGHKLLLTMLAFTLADERQASDSSRSIAVGLTGDELLREKKAAEFLESWDRRRDKVFAFLRAIVDFNPSADAHISREQLDEPGANGHAVHIWLGPGLVLRCVEISDAFGPTITEESISVLVISAETRSGGKAVNDKRKEKGWSELDIFEVDVLDPQEGESKEVEDDKFQAKLSSTSIRQKLLERTKK